MTTELLEKPALTDLLSPTLAKPPYQAQVIRSLETFAVVREEWDGFINALGTQNLCMSHGWLSIWLGHFPPKQLLILMIRDAQGQLVGLAPLQIKPSRNGLTHRILQSVEWVCTNPTVFDWMQFLVHPQADESAVVKTIAAVLQQERWDLIDLKFCLSQAQLTQLAQELPMASTDGVTQNNAIPYITLPETLPEYEAMRRKKTRLEVNRHNNRFAKEFGYPPKLTFISSSEESDALLTRFFSGHIKYWMERGQKSDFQRFPKLYDFYKDMLRYSHTEFQTGEPQLLLSVLTIGDYQLSYHLGFWQGHSYLSHLTNFNQGFRSYSPGTIHMDKLVFETLDRGGSEFEFGRGDEPYKTMWTQTKKPLWQLRIFRNPLSKALWQVDILLKKLLKKGSE